jgi:hypothetical protein
VEVEVEFYIECGEIFFNGETICHLQTQ